MPTDEPDVPITMSEKPARLAWPAKDGPDTMATVGTQPDSSAMPSKSWKRPNGPFSSRWPSPLRGWRARLPPPSTKNTTGQRCS